MCARPIRCNTSYIVLQQEKKLICLQVNARFLVFAAGANLIRFLPGW
jgi:hypothetical protein